MINSNWAEGTHAQQYEKQMNAIQDSIKAVKASLLQTSGQPPIYHHQS